MTNEKNAWKQLGLIAICCALAVWMLIDLRPDGSVGLNLRPGLDIAGGVAMIFEINDEGLRDNPNLAEDMKTLLQKRVDPKGVYNLTWRVHGRNRIEVQMPLPPADAALRRQAYIDARDTLFRSNIARGQLERLFRAATDQRAAMIERLAWGEDGKSVLGSLGASAGAAETKANERAQLITAAVDRYAAYLATQTALEAAQTASAATQPTTSPDAGLEAAQTAFRDASEQLEDAISAVLATNIDPHQFQEMVELEEKSEVRQNSLKQLRERFPLLTSKMDDVLAKHAAWRRGGRSTLESPADLQRLLRGAGVLEFRILADVSLDNPTRYDRYREQLTKEGRKRSPGQEFGWFRIDNPMQFFDLNSPAELARFDYRNNQSYVIEKVGNDFYVLGKEAEQDGLLASSQRRWSLQRAFANRDENGGLCVNFMLDVVGGQIFGELTGRNVRNHLCILIDDVAYSAPVINSRITTNGQITGGRGGFTPEKVNYLVQTMQAGALPARLKDTPVSERTIGSSLGAENLNKALFAGVIGSLVVVFLMTGYYMKFGVIAVVAVAMNVLFTLAMLAIIQARITLDALAGLILSLGMCVDANILIHERMREETERGASLRVAIKNGYDRAISAIVDGNLTTLLTSVIIYYVGSQEVRGFGLTLGWGIVLNLFTSVFVTRVLLTLALRYNIIREVKMFRAIGVPTVDWYSKRNVFLGTFIIITVVGLGLTFVRSKKDYLDVEFLGGTTATLELKERGLNDETINKELHSVSDELDRAGQSLSTATFTPVDGSPEHIVAKVAGMDGGRLAAFLTEPLEDGGLIVRGGVSETPAGDGIDIHLAAGKTIDQLKAYVEGYAPQAAHAGKNIGEVNVSSVIDTADPNMKGLLWEITTTETNKALVQHAITTALGDKLRVQQRINYEFKGVSATEPFPILDPRTENVFPAGVLPAGATLDLTDYVGGAALVFDHIQPPEPLAELRTRLRNIRLQPGYQDLPWRQFDVFGTQPAGAANGVEVYSAVVVAVVDPARNIREDAGRWTDDFAKPEVAVARAAFESEQALRKVSQFKPQIAAQAQAWAVMAVLLSWLMIIGYMWVRFGQARYGVSGVVGLVNTVLIAFAFVGFAGLIVDYAKPLANALLIENFKFNTIVLAALLTLIGYAVNDTIVTFDRIRELRGRLGAVTPELVNRAINECMSRTILTGTCVLSTLLCMYIWGGSSIRGFNYCMFIGVVAGTFSSIMVASPLLLLARDKKTGA